MEYQKIKNRLGNTPNQPNWFKTKNWVEINDHSSETYNINSQINFKTSLLRSRLCNCSDASILVSGTTQITGAGADDAAKRLDEVNIYLKIWKFEYCMPFTDCISEINIIK